MKIFKFLSIIALFIFLGALSANEASAQELKGRFWRLQKQYEASFVIIFGYDYSFHVLIKNPETGEDAGFNGTFTISKNIVKAKIKDQVLSFKIEWRTKNSIYLIGNGGVRFLYCDVDSKEDTFESDYLKYKSSSAYGQRTYSPPPFFNFGTTDNSSQVIEKCTACYGSGQCPVCNGSGKSQAPDYTGTRSYTPDCTYCSGTGRCPKCGGTGHR